jgi:hypothetical protein
LAKRLDFLNGKGYGTPVRASIVVAAWGALAPRWRPRARFVLDGFTAEHINVDCFGLTIGGQPKHPLYLPSSAPLRPLNYQVRK